MTAARPTFGPLEAVKVDVAVADRVAHLDPACLRLADSATVAERVSVPVVSFDTSLATHARGVCGCCDPMASIAAEMGFVVPGRVAGVFVFGAAAAVPQWASAFVARVADAYATEIVHRGDLVCGFVAGPGPLSVLEGIEGLTACRVSCSASDVANAAAANTLLAAIIDTNMAMPSSLRTRLLSSRLMGGIERDALFRVSSSITGLDPGRVALVGALTAAADAHMAARVAGIVVAAVDATAGLSDAECGELAQVVPHVVAGGAGGVAEVLASARAVLG